MAKIKSKFICSSCAYSTAKWMGRCPECGEWNTFEEEMIQTETKQRSVANRRALTQKDLPKKISEVEAISYQRFSTNIREFDRVLGNGVTKGSITLLGGEPGIGKSTLLMEVCRKLSIEYKDSNILYVSGEESNSQIAQRSKRLGINDGNFYILNETCWQDILEQIKKLKPDFLVLDSIQTTVSSEIQSAAGTVSQIREVTYELMNYAKSKNLTCFVVGHVTKEGSIAGPKVLEHMVDTVIYFEGDQFGQYRMLRVIKNRFGNTNEVGIFEMVESGLKEVQNPSQYFLESSLEDAYGRSLTCILEGTRPIFVEIQALVVENKFGNGRRTTQGLDNNRLSLLVAVVDKYFEIPLSFNDIYVNVVGGIKLNSRESDLAIIASLLSSYRAKKINEEVILIGEVGLTGEVRSVPMIETRIKELVQLNYTKVITSKKSARELSGKYAIEIIGIARAQELEDLLF
ncbi:MAG: DNA repair protein RadA [Bacteriovoracaceae bacterium]|jgi:DNA repair protein RadA/Sms|nr:DNA repair protein RadA [Bacteriovoracaceae bacterium]